MTFQEKIFGIVYFDTWHHLVVIGALFESRHWDIIETCNYAKAAKENTQKIILVTFKICFKMKNILTYQA